MKNAGIFVAGRLATPRGPSGEPLFGHVDYPLPERPQAALAPGAAISISRCACARRFFCTRPSMTATVFRSTCRDWRQPPAAARGSTLPPCGSPRAHRLVQRGGFAGSALEHAISDDDDLELLSAVRATGARSMVSRPVDVRPAAIGRFVAESGLWQIEADSAVRRLTQRRWAHPGKPRACRAATTPSPYHEKE
jgi:hypothetical protein